MSDNAAIDLCKTCKEVHDKEIDSLRNQLTEAQNARADTLAENGKLNDALGQIHILCSDAGIDPGNVVDRVRGLATKAQALDRLEEIAAKHHRTLVIFSVGGKSFLDLNTPASNYPEIRQDFSVGSITEAWERSKP